jgi:hypothetical protein
MPCVLRHRRSLILADFLVVVLAGYRALSHHRRFSSATPLAPARRARLVFAFVSSILTLLSHQPTRFSCVYCVYMCLGVLCGEESQDFGEGKLQRIGRPSVVR